METTEDANIMDDEAIRAAVVTAISGLRRQFGNDVYEQLSMLKSGSDKHLRVIAATDIPPGALKLVPAIPSALRVSFAAQQGFAPAVVVEMNGSPKRTVYLTMNLSLPNRRGGTTYSSVSELQQSSAVAGDIACLSDHEWKSTNFPWPFWGVRHALGGEPSNCQLVMAQMIVLMATSGGSMPEPLADSITVHVPYMTNATTPIPKGIELLLVKQPYAPKESRSKKPTYKVKTWVHTSAKLQQSK
jgi:hypothetical protein